MASAPPSSGTGPTKPGGAPARATTSGSTTSETTRVCRQTPSPNKVRILVTGAGGQLGRELIDVLVGDEVHGLDHRGLDITDQEAVLAAVEKIRPAWIVNAAAYNDVDAAEANATQAFAVNASGAGHLAAA